MPTSYSPLRYPGGKSRLTNFMKLVIEQNGLKNGIYAEPFAGGAGVALGLLLEGYVEQILINDIDPTIYSFWYSVLNYTDDFCRLISNTPVTISEWQKQKEVFSFQDTSDILSLGFATFFLNRTNRSGILKAGVIGGLKQTGNWKIDARFNKKALIKKIQTISVFYDQITLSNRDARKFIRGCIMDLPKKSLVYIDPPYFHKGQGLYLNALEPDDHILIAHSVLNEIKTPWIVSYDNTIEISSLYSGCKQASYSLSYSAANHYDGSEIIIYSDNLKIPSVPNPFKITKDDFKALSLAVA